MGARARVRRFGFRLATLSGLSRRGFFIPHRYAGLIHRPLPAYEPVERLFAAAEERFVEHLAAIEALADELLAIGGGPPPAPRWDQGWFPPLDAAALYAVMRTVRPARLVEIGSGHSTRFAARAVADGGLATHITAIDPAPRRALAGLPVEHLACPVQQAGLAPFAGLAAGDVVFIDGSHVLMPGSDLDHLLIRVLPELPAGVLVHLHDIFLPDDYPAQWDWRGYNEQSTVAAMLLGGGWQALFASRYVATRLAGRLAGGVLSRLPASSAPACSLWLVRKGAAGAD